MTPIEKLQKSLPDPLDAAIITSEHNRFYFTSFPSTDGLLFVTRERACLLVDFRYIEAGKAKARGCEVLMTGGERDLLRELAQECGVKTVGIESQELSVSGLRGFEKRLPDVRFDPSDALSLVISDLRMIKTAEEIEHIRKAQEITDAAFAHILPFVKPGVTERDLALEIEYFMKKNGASGPSFDLIVVSGENSSLPHGVPGQRKIQPGDFVTMDTGAVVDGYCSDMTRTVAVGGATSGMKHVYETVLKAQTEAMQAIREGANCRAVDRIARDIIDNAGYRGCFGHGLGHSVGVLIHEEPRLSPGCGRSLADGMLMTVEPGIYLEGKFGVRIEDLVVVRKDGLEDLTKSPKELMIL